MKSIIKPVVISLAIGLLIFIGFWGYVAASLSGTFETFYSTQDLIENYDNNTVELIEVKNYVDENIPSNISVEIEFEEDKLYILHVNNNYNWEQNIESPRTDSLLQIIGWTKNKLEILKEKLKKANCISIRSGNPINIGFQRSGMGKYFYNLFDEPIKANNRTNFNDSCRYILLNDKVVLEYGGGAVGPQCFPKN